MKTINQLVKQLKLSDTDFEFYPTTEEIIIDVIKYVKKCADYRTTFKRVLDIGCGNGNLFTKWDALISTSDSWNRENYTPTQRFGIEKSQILINEFPDNVTLLGTDFWEQSLIDKKMDLIFCNPPYSEYESWAEKIILEGNAPYIAMVIPERWSMSDRIKTALNRRGYKADVVGVYDFYDAERIARAKVNLVFFIEDFRGKSVADPFDLWFASTFPKIENQSTTEEKNTEGSIERQLVNGENIVEQLITFYNNDMEKLYSNYKAIESLDFKILKELNVDVKSLKIGLEERLSGLKHTYWNILFKRYDSITKRLTTYSRKKILDKLYANAIVDFTQKNIFSITHWIIRNANTMYDEQLKDFFLKLANTDSIQSYKSDKRFTDDEWRYIKESLKKSSWYNEKNVLKTMKNYMLDYRIVYKGYKNYEYNSLSEETYDLISDMIIIAQNLGFQFSENVFPKRQYDTKGIDWSNFNIFYSDGSIFANIRLYQNGNKHLKYDTQFMQKINIEASRLNGWIQDKEEASKEFNLDKNQINNIWGINKRFSLESLQTLLLA